MKERGVHKGKGSKNSDWLAIPIMEEYHTGANGIHTLGVETWEARYGTQASMVDKLCKLFGLDLWELGREPVKRLGRRMSRKTKHRNGCSTQRSAKNCPRRGFE